MPTYNHLCSDETCGFEWESFYSINDPVPTTCPKCGEKTAKRVISYAAPGKVELYGQELIAKLKEEGAQLRKEAYSSDTKYANLLGEDRYQSIQSNMDKNRSGRR